MTYDDEWGRPAEVGEFVKPRDLEGHLVIVFPLGYVPFIRTKFTDQNPAKPSDAITVDIVDLDDKNEYGAAGKLYRNNNFMQAQLIASLKPEIGRKVLGVMSKGVARNGMNAPWVLVDMSQDATARERARVWMQSNPNFEPTQFNLRSTGGEAQPTQQQQQQQQPRQAPQHSQQPAQQTTGYQAVAGAADMTQDELTALQHYRQQRAAAAGQQRLEPNPGFEDRPPF
jgi:hypothetical protein